MIAFDPVNKVVMAFVVGKRNQKEIASLISLAVTPQLGCFRSVAITGFILSLCGKLRFANSSGPQVMVKSYP